MLLKVFMALLAASSTTALAVEPQPQPPNDITHGSSLHIRACGRFKETCDGGNGFRTQGEPEFTAYHCGDGRGGYNNPTINLNRCIGNDGGRLVPGGAFGATCYGATVKGTTLYANCGDGHGGWPWSGIDLNTVLCNQGGNLVC
ncbi:hypothetical protein ACCO45_006173 [Purpureocillium lilacinum]|uniref:Uncharacterized protein n=1 Tax=Purpureocillium lilacinum TaxID=33203 RepID=A0ACC4DXS5_PURLI